MTSLEKIEPQEIWKNFTLINAIPRASKKEQKISDFMVDFGEQLGLETSRDSTLNVLIKKPATPNCRELKKVTLQSHLDMVHQKNQNSNFDFTTTGIEMFVDGDWVKAKETTLGADNGLGVAAIMAVLQSNTIEHPELEALFTVDEETGMTGAFALEPNFISGDILLNLDTEEDNEITIGCAGGIDFTATKTYILSENKNNSSIKISLSGLKGGHSGIDIHKGLGNANQILTRLLFELNNLANFQILSLKGGNLRNAIPREAETIIGTDNLNTLTKHFNTVTQKIKEEFKVKEPNLSFDITTAKNIKKGLNTKAQKEVLNTLYSCFNGVYTMDAQITDLVATSNNISSIDLENGKITVCCLTRSSIETEKQDLINKLTATFSLSQFNIITDGAYPGWQPNTEASIIQTITTTYQSLFKEKPIVNACHAGLECGIIGTHYPHMEMVSFGPTIKGAHSPQEKASISSTQKFWKFLKEILKNIPEKS